MKAVLCPVCEGEGELFDYTEVVRGESGTKHMKLCRGCNGKGWVEVGNTDDRLKPIDNTSYSEPPNYNKCPACGGDRNGPSLTSCPMGSHYGAYCVI